MWNRAKRNLFTNTLRPGLFRTRGDSDPYLGTGHITLGVWPPIPIPKAGESPGLPNQKRETGDRSITHRAR